MTEDQINRQLDAIRRFAADDDDERAHAAEAGLRGDFIRYVAGLDVADPDLKHKAQMVLSSSGIKFSRWFA